MNKLNEFLQFNKNFVKNEEYIQYQTCKNPKKKVVILSCMDTRLTNLLPKALNLKNGDAKIIKNAGAAIMHPFGSIMRSIIVAIYEFNVDEVMVIGHKECGMCNLDVDHLLNNIINRGISTDTINTINNSGINIKKWLHGFDSVEQSVIDSVSQIKNHPLVPKETIVHGLIMDPSTGELEVIMNGYKNKV